ncbi:STY4851/ECs_5259 family protein [Rhizobium leguminosarum]|uniref:STY4851/ECs_5259 family protein n=1 Tax=Rhizobium leguminosarum TaxID=384 RepID=UPI00048111F2|nr:STY4851/ECs_5259 family protein [Rhizobium leguminosarum]WFT85996.1 STY4851/ECs_5259 family protein [Rhizobium leguminosarum]
MLRLSEYTDAELRVEFTRYTEDLPRLDALNRELNRRDTDEAFDLQLEVVQVLKTLRKTASVARKGDSVGAWLKAFLLSRGISATDGRPLHQYRMTDAEYDGARSLLRMSRSRLDQDDGPAASLFVSFCAEWFRREATSFFLRWDALAPDVFGTIPHNRRRDLVEIGLDYWKRSLIKSETATEFLLTLAIEGGISAHVISEYGSSWLADYLRKLMRFALADGNRDHVRGFAGDMSNEIRISFRQDGFIDLCCELILKLVEWKQVADQGPVGVDPVSFLDAQHPDWKDSLPIYIPADGDRIARRLLSGLLVEKAGPMGGSGITVDRYLKFEGGLWRPAIFLTADGEVSSGKLPSLSGVGRWKASPSGELANYLPSHIALFEPPTEDQQKWRVRSLTSLDKLLVGISLKHTVTVNLTCGPEVVPIAWPGGAGVTSSVLSFLPTEVASDEAPKTLRLMKTGSASLPASKIYVLVPKGWKAVPSEGSELGPTWDADGDGILHEVAGTVYFLKPGAASGERYRIEAGKDARQESLNISSAGEVAIHAEDGIETLAGPVTLGILSEGAARAAVPGELLIRSLDDQWRPITDRKITAAGSYEISWRDPNADIQLERRRIAIVPSGGRIVGEMVGAQEGRIVHDRLPGWRIELLSEMAVLRKLDGEINFTVAGKPKYRIEALLHPPVGRPFKISVPMKVREAAIILADGSVVGAGQTIDVTALRGAIAASPHATTLTLSSRTDRSNSMQFRFAGEFPLAALKPAVQEMMAPMNDQDALLELEFLGETRIPIRLRKYRYSRPAMVEGAIVFSENFNAVPVAKMILQPTKEHLLQRNSNGSFALPEWCHGPCLVYLRDGPDIVARPLVVNRPMLDAPATRLQAALARTEYAELKADVGAALDDLSAGNLPSSDVRLLVEMAVNLNGMPATGFIALQELASRPKALLRLLLSAPAHDRQSLWALQQELPFLWLALPATAWSQTLVAESDALHAALSAMPDDMRVPMIMAHLTGLREKLIEIEPALDTVFVRAGFPALEKPSLDTVLQGFVQSQRMHDDDALMKSAARNSVLEDLQRSSINLPGDFHRFSFDEFECMAAPAALAAVAAGRLNLTATTELVVRKTLREHAHFVSCAYPHLLKFYEAQA